MWLYFLFREGICGTTPISNSRNCGAYIIFPIVIWILVVVVALFYKLDRKYPLIMKELYERELKGEL